MLVATNESFLSSDTLSRNTESGIQSTEVLSVNLQTSAIMRRFLALQTFAEMFSVKYV